MKFSFDRLGSSFGMCPFSRSNAKSNKNSIKIHIMYIKITKKYIIKSFQLKNILEYIWLKLLILYLNKISFVYIKIL